MTTQPALILSSFFSPSCVIPSSPPRGKPGRRGTARHDLPFFPTLKLKTIAIKCNLFCRGISSKNYGRPLFPFTEGTKNVAGGEATGLDRPNHPALKGRQNEACNGEIGRNGD